MPLELSRRLFTVEEYHRLAEAGVLGEDDRVELIRGEILMMSPIGSRHIYYVNRANRVLVSRIALHQGEISVQNPVIVDPRSEPQPDLLVLKPRGRHYHAHVPDRADVLLALEVADSSLAYDRRIKRPLYAEAGVPEYWILNVDEQVIERHTGPRPDGYARLDRLVRQDMVTLVALPEISIALSELLDE